MALSVSRSINKLFIVISLVSDDGDRGSAITSPLLIASRLVFLGLRILYRELLPLAPM